MEWNWLVLLIIIPAWFLELVIHEASHIIVGFIHERAKPLGFHPYPHRHKGKFYFARYELSLGKFPPEYYYENNHLPRHVAPVWAGAIIFLTLQILMFLIPTSYRILLLPSIIFGLGELIMFGWCYFFGSNTTDAKRWRYGERGKNE